MSSNQFLIDSSSRRAVFVQRYSAGLEEDMADSTRDALNALIGDISAGISPQEAVQKYKDSLTEAEEELLQGIIALAESEAEFTEEMFSEAIDADIQPIPTATLSASVINKAVDSKPGQTITVGILLDNFSDKKAQQVNRILTDAFTQGQTVEQASSQIREITGLQRRQAATVARTAANAASAVARDEMIVANDDLFQGYEWVATLDARTTPICQARDGKLYPISPSSPKPPAHYGCRSTTIPKVKPEYDKFSDVSGDRPSKGADGVEIVSSNTTYGGWLRKQPASFQDEVLGPDRGKLFRSGGLTVDKFVNFDGRKYTLDELRALNPMAFERAGL